MEEENYQPVSVIEPEPQPVLEEIKGGLPSSTFHKEGRPLNEDEEKQQLSLIKEVLMKSSDDYASVAKIVFLYTIVSL